MREYKEQDLYPYHRVLSSSQFLCYIRSPSEFYTKYVVGLPEEEGKALLLGKGFSEAYADRSFDLEAYGKKHDLPKASIKRLLAALPLLEKAERCEHEMLAPIGKWKIRATLDGYNRSKMEIIENKTGSRLWDQERVNFEDQLTFQALAHWVSLGVPPTRIVVNWIPTIKTDRIIHRFKTTRSVSNLKRFRELVELVIKNIEAGNFSKGMF